TATGTTTTDPPTTTPPPTSTPPPTTTDTTTTTPPPTSTTPPTGTTTTGTGTTPPTTTPPADTITAPAPDAAASDGHVTVSWQAIAGASGYKVFRTQAGASPVLVTTTTAPSIIDVGGTAGEAYTYGVRPMLPAATPVQQRPSIALPWAAGT